MYSTSTWVANTMRCDTESPNSLPLTEGMNILKEEEEPEDWGKLSRCPVGELAPIQL